MQQSYSSRVTVIVTVLIVALAIVFSPVLNKLVHPSAPMGRWVTLKPGIDMVGGTSLTYEIKAAPGSNYDPQLATKVTEALKRRVDPLGQKNLIWRPQGADRLEIQLPTTGSGKVNKQRSDELVAAEQQLNATNVRASDVIDAVEQKEGHTRADLDRLAQGSEARRKLFKELADTWDQLAAIRAKPEDQRDPLAEARLLETYRKQQAQIEATNLRPDDVKSALDDATARSQRIADLRKQYADFPQRLAAIDQYVNARSAYEKVRGSVDDSTDLKRMLKGSGVLEFHILVNDDDQAFDQITKMEERLSETGPGPKIQAGDTMRWFEVARPDERLGRYTRDFKGHKYVLAWITPEKSMDNRPGQRPFKLARAYPTPDPTTGELLVGFEFDTVGGAQFGDLTQANLHKPLAIVLDGKVISAPNINSKITDRGTITGGGDGFSRAELDYLVNTLSAGSLPATLADEPISEKTVEPELGRDNLRAGLFACAAGMVVVGIFLISYYNLAGVVAFGAVLMNLLLVLAVMSALQATFTLPSIAGIVLSVGTAVDANVLIFERLREEQHRGLSLRMALRNAYDKALSAILDSNATTFITSLFLIWFGTEEVKGFGITLIIGILASLFTALFVTRTVFGLLVDRFGIRQLNSLPLRFPKWDRLLRPNIDWIGMAWGFIVFSGIAITLGLVLFVTKARQGQVMDIEFAGGTSVQFELNKPMALADMRHIVETQADPNILPSAKPNPVEGSQTVYELVTPNTDSARVRDELVRVLGDNLKVVRPSSFEGVGAPIAQAMEKGQVLPITEQTKWPGNFVPSGIRNYMGGAAIVLNNLNPPISPAEITDRVNHQLLQGTPGGQPTERHEFVVVSPNGPTSPTTLAVLLTQDPDLPYAKDKLQWQEQLAGPMWRAVNDAVFRPPQLQQVRNFDAQVAGDTRNDALLALTLSILVIMAYIWVRFGNLKYGTATVLALVHDTVFTIAALGFAYYLVNVPVLRTILGLSGGAFRINLTVVAGILTIMGYSMIDTIVVFDRIRENRGKFGHVNRQVINDAINQTLSRTLLTAGTTTITVGIMYFFGGPGIHGFTFVLLIGILVGTYSSVAIAAPFLLLGNKQEQESAAREGRRLQRAGA